VFFALLNAQAATQFTACRKALLNRSRGFTRSLRRVEKLSAGPSSTFDLRMAVATACKQPGPGTRMRPARRDPCTRLERGGTVVKGARANTFTPPDCRP